MLAGVSASTEPASAAVASDFNAGSIISDALFFDGGAMSAADVQSFLDIKGASCTAGSLCLKNYVDTPTTQPAEAGLCNGYSGGFPQTAAQIIAAVGASCGVSQKVLLVTLQKEQGLVTATAPASWRYRTAMGYGCPDSSVCDTQYYGFFNQVYKAARQFKRYALTPQYYSYRAGRVNTILYSPAAGCPSSQVYIDNQATAGLYDYTPYQPDAAALANLYGTGDACSSYGNRNFWRDYTDWFGSTQVGASLVVSTTDPTVYLVTYDHKYPITDLATMESLSPLGALAYVPQSFLDSRQTGVPLGRFIRDRSGTIYLFDRGMVYSVQSCDQLAHWGANCTDYASMVLSDSQMSHFIKAGPLSYSVRTTSGKHFAVYSGLKHEVADDASAATNWPASTPSISLSDDALARLPYGPPIARPGTVVSDRGTGWEGIVDSDHTVALTPGLVAATTLRQVERPLDDASVQLLPPIAGTSGGVVKGTDDVGYAFSSGGLVRLASDQLPQLVGTAPVLGSGALGVLGPATSGLVVVGTVGGTSQFLATGGALRPIRAGDQGLFGSLVVQLSAAGVGAVPVGAEAVPPGHMIKASDSPTIYLEDGASRLYRVDSFAIPDALGISGWRVVDPSVIAASTVAPQPLSTIVACGDARFIGSGGQVIPVDQWVVAASGAPVSPLDESTCQGLKGTSAVAIAAVFLKAPDSVTVYVANNGTKRPLLSMSAEALVAAGRSVVVAQVASGALAAMPSGPPVVGPGMLVKSADGPTIFLVDGATNLVPLPSFAVSAAMGIESWLTVPQVSLAGRSVATGPLTTAIACGTARAVGGGGRLQAVLPGAFDAAGLSPTTLDPATCAALSLRQPPVSGPLFARTYDNTTLYLITGGTKRLVSNQTQVDTLTGGQAPLIALVTPADLAAVPTSWPL